MEVKEEQKDISIEELRGKIDEIDRQLVDLFCKRMEVAAGVAEYKRQRGLPVLDSNRERQLLTKISALAGEEFGGYAKVLYTNMFSLSRSYQQGLINGQSPLCQSIKETIEETPKLFPETAKVACQGIEGAYSQIATQKIFDLPEISYYRSFADVFDAVEKGECRYGVLPIENSTAGSVTKIFDLILTHKFHIVKSYRLKVDHNLLVLPGTAIEDITDIYSHEQAINQCAGFLKNHPDIKVHVCANTAVAAKMVAESGKKEIAALSSRDCALLYGLKNIAASVQDMGNNYTRFICISKDPEIYPGADKTTIMAVTANTPGALFNLLSHFFAHGINLTKLESRPIPDRDFEFMFYFDIDVSIYSPKYYTVISELEKICEDFRFLGSYSENVG